MESESVASYDEPKGYLISLGLIGTFGGMIYGYNVSSEAYLKQLDGELGLGNSGKELVSASATISDAASMIFAGQLLLDRYGRRFTVTFGALFSVFGSILGSLSSSLSAIVIARLIQGVGNGVSILSVPLLVSECAPLPLRGFLVSFFQVGVIVGFMVPIVVQLAIGQWQWTFGLGCLPGMFLLLLLVNIWNSAESKSWLHAEERHNSFIAVAAEENESLVDEDAEDAESITDLPESDRLPGFYTGATLAVVLAFTNNSSDAIIFYGPNIVEMAGVGDDGSLWTSLVLAAVNVPAVVLVLSIVKLYQRRTLILLGLTCVVICYFIIGVTFLFNPEHIFGLVFFGFFCLTIGYQIGPGTVFLMVLPEMFVQKDRASGVMFGTVAMSVFSIICNGTMLSFMEALGGGSSDEKTRLGAGRVFLIYAIAYTICLIIIYRYLPETKNREILHLHV